MQDRTHHQTPLQQLEALELRQFMSVGSLATSLSFNFEPAGTQTPDWMLEDAGAAFAAHGEFSYGWSRDLTDRAVQRHSPNAEWLGRDTLVEFDAGDSWSLAVPNGRYSVFVVAGDPEDTSGTYQISVEDQPLIDGVPNITHRFLVASAEVEVTDNRLTLTGGANSVRNRVAILTIKQLSVTPDQPDDPAPTLPDAPTGLLASDITDTAARLSWKAGASDVTGYLVDASTDGGVTWTVVAQTLANVTRTLVADLDPATAYDFRVRAVNGVGASAPSASIRVTTLNEQNEPTNPPPSTGYFDGVSVTAWDDPAKTAPLLKALGIHAVRMWSDLDWNDRTFRGPWASAIQWHNLGFQVTLLLQEDKVPTPEQAKAFFTWIGNYPGMQDGVDRWEIVNEVNLPQYWKGTLAQYVSNVLKPAYEVFHAMGEPVVGASVSFDANSAFRLRDLGYLNYVDYANFHPYGTNADQHLKSLKLALQAYAGKPLTMTEWNIAYVGTTEQGWVNELEKVRSFVTANVESAFYFNITRYTTSTYDWPAGLFIPKSDGSYAKNGIFYAQMERWIDQLQ